jgi:lipid-A-disaccharide synthase
MAAHFKDYQFVIAGVNLYSGQFYSALTRGTNTRILFGKTYDLLEHSHAALVTSGTATLETALFRVPQVVCYKGGMISFQIAKILVNVEFISLVNLIMRKEVVKELIQNEFNEKNLRNETEKILFNDAYRKRMITELDDLKNKLGGAGASEKTARLIMDYLNI